jgi:cell division protein FtsQ
MSNVAAVRSPAPALRALRLAAVVLAALGAAWLVARVAAGPLLAVRRVLVAGESPLPEAEVLAAAGIRTGEPLLGLDPDGVRARLEALPLVRHAEVRVQFPATVRLTLERREAVALVVAERDGRSLPALVDADGTIFAMARSAEEKAAGATEGIAGPEFLLYLVSSPVPVRARGSLDERLLQYSLMAQELLSKQGILGDIQELDFRGGEVVYRMKEG